MKALKMTALHSKGSSLNESICPKRIEIEIQASITLLVLKATTIQFSLLLVSDIAYTSISESTNR